MGLLDRWKQLARSYGFGAGPQPVRRYDGSDLPPSDLIEMPIPEEEGRLRARLAEDPNDVAAFTRLAQIVRTQAAAHHQEDDPQRAANDAVWALAEEVARSGRAWYPLVELARLSITDDRELALRRLGTAAERDPTGVALAHGLAMLRETGHADDAVGLGVGHWRPAEHDVEAGRQLVEAAVAAGRLGEARRHLEALAGHPLRDRVAPTLIDLERLIGSAEHSRGAQRVVDVRDERTGRLRGFLRR